ncbi:MAG: DUF3226 domain-containing protein [Polyangiaceae bacterium]|jgi:hypothetical protein
MAHTIDARIDALFVEGPDDGAVVNAFVHKLTGIDLSQRLTRLVRTDDAGGGDRWALGQFDKHVVTAREGARIGVIVDRDTPENDKWPAVRDRLRQLGETSDAPSASGAIVRGRYGIWMWPDNVSHGALETFVAGIVPPSAALRYANEASQIAKSVHGAEYESADAAKAALKVRSIWRDASAAGGYGHLVRNLQLVETPASKAFVNWFTALYLT